jgi:hypothetical protein
MKAAGTIAIAVLATFTVASPALAGKKKKAAAKKEEAPKRRLCDELGLGITLAQPTGKVTPASTDVDAAAAQSAGSFDLSRLDDRRGTTPTGDGAIRMEALPLTEAQVGQVVRSHRTELDYCWSRLPAAQRSEGGSFDLQLTIEPKGTVASVTLGGDAPATLGKCVTAAAKRWTFPVADTRTELGYAVGFSGKK